MESDLRLCTLSGMEREYEQKITNTYTATIWSLGYVLQRMTKQEQKEPKKMNVKYYFE